MSESVPLSAGGGVGSNNQFGSLAAGGAAPSSSSSQSEFVCNVCLESVKDPVVTQCGHLYCWSCLYRWLNTNHTTCPVCKAGVTQENVIPLFIRGGCEADPRLKTPLEGAVPNRPQGRRPLAEPQMGMGGAAGEIGGISFSGSFGFFPSLFGLQFQSFTPPPPTNRPLTPEEAHHELISKVVFFLGCAAVACLLLF